MDTLDTLQAESWIAIREIPPALVDGREGWLVEMEPMSIAELVRRAESEDSRTMMGGREVWELQCCAIVDADGDRHDADDLDFNRFPAPLQKWLAMRALDLAVAGERNLGEGWRWQPGRSLPAVSSIPFSSDPAKPSS